MLNKTQIRFLKSTAHHLHPVILIGNQGTTQAVQREINTALNAHELIKIKLPPVTNNDQLTMIDEIITAQHAEFVQKIGHIAIIYRHNPQQPKITLPRA
ncbi:YhbY family RNA-binding protein [Dichelobacter nodosus]|uniref:YhbY family RNA-binding protein n=1 Tax=Dichelobacter nodosus TaxID=870 RepID=UPI000682D1BB|nr:YhbY family RNA-binding protein [Dichelobacter nodosus]KNZ39450.1 RNA-binding protein YhbY [Dichelobacter nodosus]